MTCARDSKEEIEIKTKVGRRCSHGHAVKDVFRKDQSGEKFASQEASATVLRTSKRQWVLPTEEM